MDIILQSALPPEMRGPKSLPGVAPCCVQDWLRIDDAYAAQMAYRTALLAQQRDAVLYPPSHSLPAAQEALAEVLKLLPGLGFACGSERVVCPDGRSVALNWQAPLETLCHLIQQDICLMEKAEGASEHCLTGAILCFPANWRLAEKAGRPLSDIHSPVAEYDPDIARRVQRMFDGVQVGRPLWRMNWLAYEDADLHQPYRKKPNQAPPYIRSERQTLYRLPQTRAVIFAIHTYVVQAV